ncbi:17113_t:CDS:2, partial [Racocetra fulgida]
TLNNPKNQNFKKIMKNYPVKEFLKKHSKLLTANTERERRILEYRDVIYSRIIEEIRKYYRRVQSGDYRYDGMPEISRGIHEKFPPPGPNPDEPNQPEENFSPPVVAEPAKRQTPPRDAQGRFIKKVVAVMVDAQKWLDEKYPNKKEIIKIDGIRKKLTENKLTELTITNCPNLRIINARINQLTNLDVSNCPNLTNLCIMYDGPGKIEENNFFGSLKALENCKDLKKLNITNQPNIKGGLEFLPTEKLTHFGCDGTEFEEQLKPFNGNVKKWQLAQKTKKPEVRKSESGPSQTQEQPTKTEETPKINEQPTPTDPPIISEPEKAP